MIDPGQRLDAKELIDLIELVIIFIKKVTFLKCDRKQVHKILSVRFRNIIFA